MRFKKIMTVQELRAIMLKLDLQIEANECLQVFDPSKLITEVDLKKTIECLDERMDAVRMFVHSGFPSHKNRLLELIRFRQWLKSKNKKHKRRTK